MTAIDKHPVDSATRECCHGVARHTPDCSELGTTPDVPIPDGADFASTRWDTDGYRGIFGFDRTMTDHPARVYSLASQRVDGAIDLALVVVADGDAAGPA
ncbi:hypothetical protein A5709_01875 [Mycobacterium sp. E1386]|uniref:hypothetical protein n=1 Tax=Mycobacterium sp. E1386 TaxID=1834126 RepID=UPI000800F979|nr:hypothetical protein [Mycobacterium sp. E1386]OBI31856.1 hypothetical protein A5709_01875 [Mycobacterium sp. E1386]